MKNLTWMLPALLLVFAIGYFLGRGAEAPDPDSSASVAEVWTCSMHPQVRAPEPGDCPICGMDLIPLEDDTADGATSIQLSQREQELARVETAEVQLRPVERTLDLFGRLEVPEPSLRTVTLRVEGRIEAVHVDHDGAEVRRGTPLVDLYSPALYAAQQEFLDLIGRGGDVVEAARERLIAWGMNGDQVIELERSRVAREVVTLRAQVSGVVIRRDAVEGAWLKVGAPLYAIAPLDDLWFQMEVFESDLEGFRKGLPVRFTLEAFPGKTFTGEVDFVGRVVDPSTHSVFARVLVPNPDSKLRPGMFARATVRVPVEGGAPVLVIPASAPLITGRRAVVYVEDPHHPGEYHLRRIETGPRVGEEWVVRSGLAAGERVVSRGAFRIDSSLQIQGEPSMMSAPTTEGGTQ